MSDVHIKVQNFTSIKKVRGLCSPLVEFKGSCRNQNLVSNAIAKKPCQGSFYPYNLSVFIMSANIISPQPNLAGCLKQTENISQKCTFIQPKFRVCTLILVQKSFRLGKILA